MTYIKWDILQDWGRFRVECPGFVHIFWFCLHTAWLSLAKWLMFVYISYFNNTYLQLESSLLWLNIFGLGQHVSMKWEVTSWQS